MSEENKNSFNEENNEQEEFVESENDTIDFTNAQAQEDTEKSESVKKFPFVEIKLLIFLLLAVS